MKILMTVALILSFVAGLAAQDPSHAMGFGQATTTHHFLLAPDGGSIEVTTNDPADTATRQRIRDHLRQIARDFAAGNFDRPRATHGETPPGADVMHARRKGIDYTFEDLPAGGRVRIRTRDAKARAAIHDFLRYQIRAHGTGDPRY